MKLSSFVFGKALVGSSGVYTQIPQYLGEWIKSTFVDSNNSVCPSRGQCNGGGITCRKNNVDMGDGSLKSAETYYCDQCNSYFMVLGDMFFGSNYFV